MNKIRFIILTLCMISTSLKAQSLREAEINWLSFESLNDSLASNPKPVFIFIHTDWCVYCKKMLNEAFQDPEIIKKVNQAYYAIQFDAEQIDTIRFDAGLFTNTEKRKKRGKYHSLAKILIGDNKPVFPVSIVLDNDFFIKDRKFIYLSKQQLLKFL
ncbi:thioredoxin family protein [Sphingobacterium sp. HJSM2_6]|uniref:thioredoxin family protein n=1 Tax=Sphingobacterium sp. HJSM2_6 TaxID=3366264 RepID=UPI003BD16622